VEEFWNVAESGGWCVKISIITPSFNQGRYLERTVRSVLSQEGDFELEYLVIDGGSRDESVEILRRYGDRLRWVSEPDGGQSDAINKGFRMATGDVLAWLNSDDTYEPGALACVAGAYREEPFDWCFGDCRIIDEEDREIRKSITRYKMGQSRRYSFSRLLRRDFISQPSTFFAARAYRETGEIRRDLAYSMDYDYWLRLGRKTPPRYVNQFLANFRWHAVSKNGSAYRLAAWETLRTARQHSRLVESGDVLLHFGHYCALSVLYRFM
jgi:glycosyltransferase involved in cell wall biosynthesis